METFVWFRAFYLVWKIFLSAVSLEAFIYCGDFCTVQRLLFSAETFIQYQDCYRLQRVLSSAETFIQCGDFCLVWRFLSSAKSFIQCGDFFSKSNSKKQHILQLQFKILRIIILYLFSSPPMFPKMVLVRLIKDRTQILKDKLFTFRLP